MRSMRVELRFAPETTMPIHDLLCTDPDLERELILGGQAVDGVETITSFVYGEPAAYESLLEAQASVLEYDVTPTPEGFFVYARRELGPDGESMFDALARDTVVVVPPVEVRADRTIRLTLVGHPDDLREVLELVPDGVELDVRHVGDGVSTTGLSITDRQREALRVARDVGYYDVPRRNGIEAVAAELECAVSTASELLRRGEARAVEGVLEAGP